jgi:hypothetical protein
VPFASVNAVFLVRTVNDSMVKCSETCSNVTHSNTMTVMLCVLLKSIASLMYEVMKLRTMPEVWQEHQRLLNVKAQLAARAMRLNESECQQDSPGESDEDEDEGKAAGSSELKNSADPAMCSVQTVRAHQKMVVEVTFEMGAFPECGR